MFWQTQNCTNGDPAVEPPLLTVNSLHVDLTRQDIRVVPAMADPVAQVQTIPEMATQNDKFIAGVNGGAFIASRLCNLYVNKIVMLRIFLAC